jgi:hypothetical protein
MIHIKEIHDIENRRHLVKKELYKKIYEDLVRKIRNAVTFGHKQTILHVPGYVFGYPSYDILRVTQYMKRQLEHAGFTIYGITPGELYVSWKKEEKLPSRGPPPPPDEDEFPTFVNLKKIANKLRKQ